LSLPHALCGAILVTRGFANPIMTARVFDTGDGRLSFLKQRHGILPVTM
jgi:hypothetical protein